MMSKAYSLSEPTALVSGPDRGAVIRSWIFRWLQPLKASVAKVDIAHARRCDLASLPQDVLQDTGLPPEGATGITDHQPDLPFFMQSGFGRR